MNDAHWHLLLNHMPILGSIFGLFLLLAAVALKSTGFYKIALAWIVFIGLIAIPTYITGQNAHEVLHPMQEVAFEAIDVHEQWATYALYAIETSALIALSALLLAIFRPNKKYNVLRGLVVFSLIISTGLVVYTGSIGGTIRHIEIERL